MSWLTPVIGEILGDSAATSHKTNFFENGANLGYVVTLDPEGTMNPDQFKRWVDTFKIGHEGARTRTRRCSCRAARTSRSSAPTSRISTSRRSRAPGETRIAAAAGVPAIIAGFSEGLESATYSNYGQARGRSLTGRSGRCGGISRGRWRRSSTSRPIRGSGTTTVTSRSFRRTRRTTRRSSRSRRRRSGRSSTRGSRGSRRSSAVTNGDMTMLEHTGPLQRAASEARV
jgi:hypothetical protein